MQTSSKHVGKKQRSGQATSRGTKRTKKPKYKYGRPEYTSLAYQTLVRTVRERDRCRCQFPGCKRHTYGIIVHHIIRWADSVGLRYNPTNCVCLCQKCHDRVTGNELAYAPLFLQIAHANTIKQEKKIRGYNG